MKRYLITFAVFLVGCAPSVDDIQSAIAQTQQVWTAIPTQTPYPTQTPWVVTKLVTPEFTSTPKNTPTITNTPLPTTDPLKATRGDGFYLVNIDIAPGVWRSLGTNDNCYWKVSTETGDIIDNHFGMSGGTAYISADAFQVEFQGCGKWEFLK